MLNSFWAIQHGYRTPQRDPTIISVKDSRTSCLAQLSKGFLLESSTMQKHTTQGNYGQYIYFLKLVSLHFLLFSSLCNLRITDIFVVLHVLRLKWHCTCPICIPVHSTREDGVGIPVLWSFKEKSQEEWGIASDKSTAFHFPLSLSPQTPAVFHKFIFQNSSLSL